MGVFASSSPDGAESTKTTMYVSSFAARALLRCMQAAPSAGQQDSTMGCYAVHGYVEEMLPKSFLQRSIGGFLTALNDCVAPPELRNEADRLRALLRLRLGMNVDMREVGGSDDEDGPVVIES